MFHSHRAFLARSKASLVPEPIERPMVEDRGRVAQIVGQGVKTRGEQLHSQLGTSGAEGTEAWQQGERVTDPAFGDSHKPRAGQVGRCQPSLATARRTTTVTLSLPPPSSASCTRASHTCLAEVIERNRSRIWSSET